MRVKAVIVHHVERWYLSKLLGEVLIHHEGGRLGSEVGEAMPSAYARHIPAFVFRVVVR